MKSIKIFGRLLASFMVIGSAIACSDLTEIEDRLDVIESDITALQNQLTSVNANFEALQYLKEGGIVINTVEKTEKGYTLTLSNGEVIELELVVEEKAPEKVEVLGNVEVTDSQVKITLADGTVVTVPVVEDFVFAVTFSSVPVTGEQVFEQGETKEFDVEQKNVASAAIVAYPDGFKVQLTDNKLTVSASNTISFNAGASNQTKASASSENEIAILAVSTSGHAVLTKFQVKVEAPKLTPNVSFTNVTTHSNSLNSLTFAVDFRQEAAEYVAKCVKSGDAAPTLEELMALEATAKADGENKVTFSNLDPETEYTVYALAKNAAGEWGEVITVTASTRAVDTNNLYEVYTMGSDIEIAGMKINKTTHGKATLIANDSENKDINGNGVYFVKSDATDVTINGTASQIVVLSADANMATIKRTENKSFYINASAEPDYLIFSNIKYETVMTSGNVFGVGGDGDLETIFFNKCKIEIPADMNMLYGTKNILNFNMTDCDVKLHKSILDPPTEKNLVQTNTENTYATLVFKNNIFYCTDGDLTGFRLFSNDKATIASLEFRNNTIAGVYCKAAYGYVSACSITSGDVVSNLFYLPNYTTHLDTKYIGILWVKDKQDSHLAPVSNLAFYNYDAVPSYRLKPLYYGSGGTIYNKAKAANPIPSPDYANGVFTQGDDYKSFGAKR